LALTKNKKTLKQKKMEYQIKQIDFYFIGWWWTIISLCGLDLIEFFLKIQVGN